MEKQAHFLAEVSMLVELYLTPHQSAMLVTQERPNGNVVGALFWKKGIKQLDGKANRKQANAFFPPSSNPWVTVTGHKVKQNSKM